VGTYCYVAVCRRGRLGGARRFGAHSGRRGVGHIVAAARLQLVIQASQTYRKPSVSSIVLHCPNNMYKVVRISDGSNGLESLTGSV